MPYSINYWGASVASPLSRKAAHRAYLSGAKCSLLVIARSIPICGDSNRLGVRYDRGAVDWLCRMDDDSARVSQSVVIDKAILPRS